jgi:transposase-like protein
MVSTYFWRTLIHSNRSSRRVHSAEFKAQILSECRQSGASVSAAAIAHGLNTNVVRKWLDGRGFKRMSGALPSVSGIAPALPFVPLELPRPGPAVDVPASRPDIRIELQWRPARKVPQCAASACAQ